MGMEDIDLGRDRSNLIELIYGDKEKKEDQESVTASVETAKIALTTPSEQSTSSRPPIPPRKMEKPKKTRSLVTCSVCNFCVFLFVVLAAIAGAAIVSHIMTKEALMKQIAELQNLHPIHHKKIHSKTETVLQQLSEEEYEKLVPIEPTKEKLALPLNTYPIATKVTIQPNLASNSADGHLFLKFNVTKETDEIVLNARDVDLGDNIEKIQLYIENSKRAKRQENATLESSGEGSGESEELMTVREEMNLESEDAKQTAELSPSGVKVKEVFLNEDLEKATFKFDTKLAQGKQYVLKVPFRTRTNHTNGLNSYPYRTMNGTKSILVTQPEFQYLRHVFPSFDQQLFEQQSEITLLHSPEVQVVAASKVTRSPEGTSSTIAKSATPDFVLGELVGRSVQSNGGLKINLWVRPEVANLTDFALNFANEAVDAMEHYLQTRLECEKIDIVGVPDLDDGGRVTPALILIPEHHLLLDTNVDDVVTKVENAKVIANKIAAQWFRDVGHAEDFGSFWLNFALPKLLEIEIIDKALGINGQALHTLNLEKSLQKDARATSQPLIQKNVFTSAQIATVDTQFDAEKGAAILNMLRNAVTENVFKKVIRTFVSSHRRTHPFDAGLWESFQKVVPKMRNWNGDEQEFKEVADTWTTQIGYPLLTVSNLDETEFEISQDRFKDNNLTPEKMKFRNAKYWFNWEVPIVVQVNGSKKGLEWLHEAYRLPANETDEVLLNTDGTGYYRTNYGQKTWRKIVKTLQENPNKYSESTRVRLISDLFALGNAQALPIEFALNASSYLAKENSEHAWLVAVGHLRQFVDNLKDTPDEDKFNEFVSKIISSKFAQIDTNNNNDDYLKSLLNSELLQLQCEINPLECRRKLKQIFNDKFAKDCLTEDGLNTSAISSQCSSVPTWLRDQVYCDGVAYGDDIIFDQFLKMAGRELNSIEKRRLEASLACSRDPRLLKKQLRSSLTNPSVAVNFLKSLKEQDVGDGIATDFVIDNWSTIKKQFGSDKIALNELVSSAVSIDSEREKHELETFIAHHKRSTFGLTSLDEKLEEATTEIDWKTSFQQPIGDFLSGKFLPLPVENDDGDDY